MNQLQKYEIIHLYYNEHDTIDEIVKYFDGKVSKYERLNLDNDAKLNIVHSQIQLMTG